MAEIVRLSEKPFDEDEFVTLWWLRSPWRESTHRQWAHDCGLQTRVR